MHRENAIVLTNGLLHTDFAKTCHGLLRGSERFAVVAVIDPVHAGKDAGIVMDGKAIGMPIYASVEDYLGAGQTPVDYCIVGVAVIGGALPEEIRSEVRAALLNRMHVVCGLHTLLGDDPEFSRLANAMGVNLIDIRRPRPAAELSFWSGAIHQVQTPRIAVLGIDCAVGKRTTCRFLRDACRASGIQTEMIYTGQTGWMQGYRYGFILDATLNDFVGGELERAIVACEREARPDLILVEGQASLRYPAGPCGSEFILSGAIGGVVLQHIPGRKHFEGTSIPLVSVESEVELIRFYGAEVLAICLNSLHLKGAELEAYRQDLQKRLQLPVTLPLEEGVHGLVPVVRHYMQQYQAALAARD